MELPGIVSNVLRKLVGHGESVEMVLFIHMFVSTSCKSGVYQPVDNCTTSIGTASTMMDGDVEWVVCLPLISYWGIWTFIRPCHSNFYIYLAMTPAVFLLKEL